MEIPDISSCLLCNTGPVTDVIPAKVDKPDTFTLVALIFVIVPIPEFILPTTVPVTFPLTSPVTSPVKLPTNPVAVTIPDALTSPKELIPTPFCPELTSLPTCNVNIAAVVAIPTLPPVLYILLTPVPTIVSSHCDVGRFNRFIY